jgi:hypothetical protein
MPKLKQFLAYFLFAAFLAASSTGLAANQVATITTAQGEVSAVLPTGETRKLAVGDRLVEGAEIKTGRRSGVAFEFVDKSRFELGSNASMNLTKFSMGDPVKQEPPSFLSRISIGTFRFVSGLIARGNPNAMKVRGAVATIGIRGTNVVGEFKADSARVILLEPEGEPHPTAIDVSNQFGSVTIDEPGYGTDVPDANSPPTPPRRMRMRTINNLMNSIRSVQRISVPRPRPHMY